MSSEFGRNPAPRTPVAHWRIILAFVLDLFLAFWVFGYLAAWLTGGLTENGFALSGRPATLMLGLIVAYFVIGGRTGGTVWQRILRTKG